MSGFSSSWLALREPADHAAVNPDVRKAVAAHFADRNAIALTDLGCGAGSNLRGLSGALPASQSWRLVDYDRALLQAARRSVAGWADDAREDDQVLEDGEDLHVQRAGVSMNVSFLEADLAADVEAVLDRPCDLVTCAAFFDLVSPQWLTRFADALASRKLPLYGVLTYDGIQRWQPPHALDVPIADAFNAHQHGDKGFGQAAGPDAVHVLSDALEARGYRVMTGTSPWTITQNDRALLVELVDGIAGAAAQAGQVGNRQVASQQADAWRKARHDSLSCEIGHLDIFAVPA